MDKFIGILEEKQQPLEETIDGQKVWYIALQISIWDFFGIPQANYLALDKNEKSRMLSEYYSKLVLQYFGKKIQFFLFGIFWILVWLLAFDFWLSDLIFFSGILGKHSGSGEIDTGISSAVKGSTKLSMAKNVLDGRVETTITAEKEACFKRNTTDLWKKYVFFKQQACNFSIEKSNMPEMIIFYLNQAYQSSKGNKKSYYSDLFILGQVTPCLNPPENLNLRRMKPRSLGQNTILFPDNFWAWWKHLAIWMPTETVSSVSSIMAIQKRTVRSCTATIKWKFRIVSQAQYKQA